MGTVTLDVSRGNVEESIEVPEDSVYLGAQGLTSVNLHPLSGSGKLHHLWLYNNHIAHLDMTPLASSRHLRSLSLRNNCLESLDLSPLSRCARLEELDLSNNRIKSLNLGPISCCTHLRRLDVSGNLFEQILLQPVGSCSDLRALVLGQSELGPCESVRPCGPDTMGSRQESSHAQTIDVSPLFSCDQLSAVTVRGEAMLALDPALWYVAAAKVLADQETPTLVRGDKSAPALAWMNKSLFSRLLPLSYEAVAVQTGAQNLRNMIATNIKSLSKRHWFHAQKGLLEGFALSELSGYDANPQSILDLPSCPQQYAAFKAALRRHVVELLANQITAGGPTLFLDIDTLLAQDESALAEMIVRVRSEEMEKLIVPTDGSSADISGLVVTSYGHSIVRALGEKRIRLPLMDYAKVDRALRDAGFIVKTERGKSGRISSPLFPKVSSSLISFVIDNSLDLSPMKEAGPAV